jgi:hypothetical protein
MELFALQRVPYPDYLVWDQFLLRTVRERLRNVSEGYGFIVDEACKAQFSRPLRKTASGRVTGLGPNGYIDRFALIDYVMDQKHPDLDVHIACEFKYVPFAERTIMISRQELRHLVQCHYDDEFDVFIIVIRGGHPFTVECYRLNFKFWLEQGIMEYLGLSELIEPEQTEVQPRELPDLSFSAEFMRDFPDKFN